MHPECPRDVHLPMSESVRASNRCGAVAARDGAGEEGRGGHRSMAGHSFDADVSLATAILKPSSPRMRAVVMAPSSSGPSRTKVTNRSAASASLPPNCAGPTARGRGRVAVNCMPAVARKLLHGHRSGAETEARPDGIHRHIPTDGEEIPPVLDHLRAEPLGEDVPRDRAGDSTVRHIAR